jgi:hypothetical protein
LASKPGKLSFEGLNIGIFCMQTKKVLKQKRSETLAIVCGLLKSACDSPDLYAEFFQGSMQTASLNDYGQFLSRGHKSMLTNITALHMGNSIQAHQKYNE